MKGDVNIWIIVDNLRIGGIERLALDQMYFLSDSEIRSKLFVLDKQSTLKAGNFLNVESDLIENKRLNFEYCPTNFLHLIIFFIKQLLTHKPTLILDYTLKATLVLRLLKIILNFFALLKQFFYLSYLHTIVRNTLILHILN